MIIRLFQGILFFVLACSVIFALGSHSGNLTESLQRNPLLGNQQQFERMVVNNPDADHYYVEAAKLSEK